MIKASQLILEQKQREAIKYTTFDKIYTIVEKRISLASKGGQYYTWYAIPELIIGLPLFSIEECKTYIVDKLKKNEFKSEFFAPNILFIKWFPTEK